MSSSELLSRPPATDTPAIDGKFRVRIARDAYEVFLDELTPPIGGGKPVTASQILAKLKKLKVTNGIDRAAIDQALADVNSGKVKPVAAESGVSIVIVRGRAARDGTDGVLTWTTEPKTAGAPRVVRPQQIIGRYVPATAGEPGIDVFGNKTRARDGVDTLSSCGSGILAVDTGEGREFTALFYGCVQLDGGVLSVNPFVTIAPDKLTATMTLHPLDDEAVTLPHIIVTLTELGVRHGICESELESALTALNHSRQVQDDVVVARGQAAVDEQPATIAWRIPLATICTAMAVVRRGDILAEVTVPAAAGANGRDVLGNELPAKTASVAVPQAGDGVEIIEQGPRRVYAAKIYGRIAYGNDVVSVVTPLYVEDDRMKATMDVYKTSSAKDGRAVCEADILEALASFGVVVGLQLETIRHALQQLAGSSALLLKRVVVAKGTPAVDGVDESLALVDKVSSGKVLQNGRIDFHDHNYPVNVMAGAVVARRVAAVPARMGCDVLGNEIPGREPKPLELTLEGVEEQADGVFVASRDGALLVSNGALAVTDLLAVGGDVGPATGNIDAKLNVHVKGYVIAGFRVAASGDVVVQQNIEQARVDVGGSLVVHGGVRGGQSDVCVKGTMQAQFIELGKVRVDGDVAIGKALVNCDLRSCGAIRIADPSKGAILGGQVRAQSGITAAVLGSAACVKTRVELELPAPLIDDLAAMKARLEKIKNDLTGLEALCAQCAAAGGQDGNATCHKICNTVDAMRNELASAQSERDDLIARMAELKQARVRVLRRVFPGVQIRLFGISRTVDKELGPGEFYLKGDEIAFESR